MMCLKKLDEERIANLLAGVCKDNEGQVFITDTSCERLKNSFENLELPFQLIEL